MAYVPADRRARGAVMSLTLRENLALPDLTALSAARIHLRRRRERDAVRTWTHRLDIRPAEPERRLELFSGGNQQKAVIAKWLRLRPRVLLLDEPTQGVDVGASQAIRRLLRDARAEGMAVLIASSDNRDLTDTCDRVLVMRDGIVACELTGDDINDHRITQECLGSRGEIATGRSLPSKETP
jgi:ABC-type sugar transport system ATPase subunit